MARDALTGLANAEGDVVAGSDMPVPVSRIAEEINETAASFGLELGVVAPAGLRAAADQSARTRIVQRCRAAVVPALASTTSTGPPASAVAGTIAST